MEPQVVFDLGLPNLPLELTGPVQLSVGFDWAIGVGVSKTHGAFLDTSLADEITIDFDAIVQQISSDGKLGFMPVTVAPTGGQSIRTSGTYTIDILDPQRDGFLSFADIAGNPAVGSVIASSLTGGAGVDSNLAVTLETNLGTTPDGSAAAFPPLRMDFAMAWDFDQSSAPTIDVSNLQFELVGFTRDTLGHVVGEIRQVLEPMSSSIDVLNAAVPILDILGIPTSWRGLPKLIFGAARQDDQYENFLAPTTRSRTSIRASPT